jgi:hypothetical protein
MFRLLFVLSMLMSADVLRAQDFFCQVEKEKIALEVVKLELLGLRLSDHFKCLEQEKFKYIKARHEPPEEGLRRFDIGVKLETLKIVRLEAIDEGTGQYFAHFEVVTTKKFGSKKINDKSHIVIHPSKKIQELEGCADALFGPSSYYLAESCYTP